MLTEQKTDSQRIVTSAFLVYLYALLGKPVIYYSFFVLSCILHLSNLFTRISGYIIQVYLYVLKSGIDDKATNPIILSSRVLSTTDVLLPSSIF